MRKILFALAAAALLAGCGTMPPPEAPKNFVEQVAYWEARMQAAGKTVDQLTCYKGYDAKGLCLEAGKPLSPALALQLLTSVGNARQGLRTAVALPEGGGVCLGKVQSPAACLQAATQILLEVEVALRKQQGG